MSLVILTVGVMLCNLKTGDEDNNEDKTMNKFKGVCATLGEFTLTQAYSCSSHISSTFIYRNITHLFPNFKTSHKIGIACSSGFASVYTEKVIKAAKKTSSVNREDFGLAYTQVQLAFVSLVVLGLYALVKDFKQIIEYGFLQNYDTAAFATSVNSAVGGLIVASVLKYANSLLKGYATAVSVVLTGIVSSFLFSTHMSVFYGLGIVNVIIAVLLYNGSGLDDVLC